MTKVKVSVLLYGNKIFLHEKLWTFEEIDNWRLIKTVNTSATEIRDSYFQLEFGKGSWMDNVPTKISDYLVHFATTESFKPLIGEYKFVENYINKTQHDCHKGTNKHKHKNKQRIAGEKYYVQIPAADPIAWHANHVLMIRRAGYPGKGQLALPGGIIDPWETAHNAVFRELYEETQIDISTGKIKDFLRGEENGYRFDHPRRDVRGRIATQGFFIKIPDHWNQPKVKAASDAKQALWVSYYDLFRLEDNIYADHLHIIYYLVNKLGQVAA